MSKPPREKLFSSTEAQNEYEAKQRERAERKAQDAARVAAKSPRVDLPDAYYDCKCVGWTKTPKGYVVIAFELHDGQVHSPEVLSEPSPKPVAAQLITLEIARRFIRPPVGGSGSGVVS